MSALSGNYDYLYKVVVTGGEKDATRSGYGRSSNPVGVSSLISRFVDDQFSLETRSNVGASFAGKNVTVEGKVIKLQIWDGVQGRYSWHGRSEYRGAVAYALVYDIANSRSFESIKAELAYIRENRSDDAIIFLVGNKSDLRYLREIPTDEAREFAEQQGLPFIETSALDASNVNELFSQVATAVYGQSVARKKAANQVQALAEQKAHEPFRDQFHEDLQRVLGELQTDLASGFTMNAGQKKTANDELLKLRNELSGKQFDSKTVNEKLRAIFEHHPEINRVGYVGDFLRKYFNDAPESGCSVM